MTPEDLAAFEKRAAQWRKEGTVRTHTLEGEKTEAVQKYGNHKVTVGGITYHSKKEAARHADLKLMEAAKEISGLRHQVRYELTIRGQRICAYIADFVYIKKGEERETVEDSKGYRTKDYVIKRKLMKAIHGIEVFET